ncbi:MAG: DUF3617 domain-containing protein [Zoogloeaceae bacterium]|nr:DUF3617 domain-containing protein [Zoogloeaceae bacterium]
MFAEKTHCAQRVTPTTPRILAAYKERQGLREKGWAWLPMLGALVVGAAVVTVGAMLLYKNFKTTGNDAAISSGQSSNRADARPKPSAAKPQAAEAEPTEDMTAPKEELAASNTMKEVKCDSGATGMFLCPGLWEVTISFSPPSTMPPAKRKEMEAAMANTPQINVNDLTKQMEAMMVNMPPAERKKMETAIADMKEKGVKMTASGGAAQICITGGSDFKFLPLWQGKPCSTHASSRGSNKTHFTVSCPGEIGDGLEAEFTIHSDTAWSFTGLNQMKCEKNNGKSGTGAHIGSGSGRWLGPDCGSIKPDSSPDKCDGAGHCLGGGGRSAGRQDRWDRCWLEAL